jgi:hypothetical protein
VAVLRVPGEFATIEAAQNNGSEGDTILLAPGSHASPQEITKAIHIKGDTETPGDVVITQVPGKEYCLNYVLQPPIVVPKIFCEGVLFSHSYGTSHRDELSDPTVLATLEFVYNRCIFGNHTTYHLDNLTKYQDGILRIINCDIDCDVAEINNVDDGFVYLERCYLESYPWNNLSILLSSDYVTTPTADYGTAYGEWLAPFFMDDGQSFRYRGTVTVDGDPPASALPLYLIRRDTGAFVSATTCEAGSGEFEFVVLSEQAQNPLLVVSPGTDDTQPVAVWPINPELG